MAEGGTYIKAEEWSAYRHLDVGVRSTLLFWSDQDGWLAVVNGERAAARVRRPANGLDVEDLVYEEQEREDRRFVRGGEIAWPAGAEPSFDALLERWVMALASGSLPRNKPYAAMGAATHRKIVTELRAMIDETSEDS